MRRFLGILSIVISVAVSAWLVVTNEEPEPDVDAAAPMTVEYQVVEAGPVTDVVVGYGRVSARWETTLASEVGGRVIRVSEQFLAGASFRAGDLLAVVEPTSYETAVAVARSSLAVARRVLAEEEERSRIARETWLSTGLGGEPSGLALRQPQVEEARAGVAAAEAAVRQASLDLARTRITAPYDGYVLERSISPGDFVERGTPVGRIFDRSVFEVAVPLSLEDLARLPAGTRDRGVRLASASAGRLWYGSIARIEQAVDNRNHWRNVIVEVADTRDLVPGQILKVEFDGRDFPDLLRVPERQIAEGGGVWFIDDRDVLRTFDADPALSRNGYAWVRIPDGVGPSVRVVAHRSVFLPDVTVTPVPGRRQLQTTGTLTADRTEPVQ